MNEVTTWDYDASVTRVRPKVMKLKTLTLDVYHDLWEAREALSTPAWNKASDGTNDPPLTWAQYCEDVGLVKRTVNRWLQRYDPEKRQLIEAPIDQVSRLHEGIQERSVKILEEYAMLIALFCKEYLTAGAVETAQIEMISPEIIFSEAERMLESETDLGRIMRAQNALQKISNSFATMKFSAEQKTASVLENMKTAFPSLTIDQIYSNSGKLQHMLEERICNIRQNR